MCKIINIILLVDTGVVTLANPTHVWIKGVIHGYHVD
jgi:hypothetical protein